MDQIFIWIIILFAIILILDYSDKLFKSKKSNEHFTDAPDNYTSGNLDVNEKNYNVVYNKPLQKPETSLPIYYEENKLNVFNPTATQNAMNFTTSSAFPPKLNFSDFTTSGVVPSFTKCPSCELQFDCSNYPYNSPNDKNASVCTKCNTKNFVDDNNYPVFARSVGRPRVCKNLVSDSSDSKCNSN